MKPLNRKRLGERIDALAAYDLSQNKVFGSAYAVWQNGVLLEKCYGVASPESGIPVTNRSLFRLASMTKPISAVAALILAERGLISLDDEVGRFLPAFRDVPIIDAQGNRREAKTAPTVRHLLTHTSGIGCFPEKLEKMTDRDRETLDASLAFYAESGLDFEPGSMETYSGRGAFDVLVKIIETVTGTDCLSFFRKEIFAPCGMTDTTFEPTPEQWERVVAMHGRQNGESIISEMPSGCVFESYPCTHYLGGAGLVSTLRDYARFAAMLLAEGKTEGGRILRAETLALMRTPQVSGEIMPGKERWGLGVRVITDAAHRRLPVGCFGWSGAYGSHFWVDPENKLFAVLMKNSRVDGGSGNESANLLEEAVRDSL